ncbi:AN1-type zinc finger protein TMC1 [Daldinia childiae]|uniref:AN1-type zinc finger protein TMC1 n=1 Tax=Daldinia childiae TaxID=326645 RepID=UPI0014480910|nr:AN1-type zinc finger protein TMC1 [Daldinia childiae]KAF3058717.1 AN1-type zinc finger protein TMC1 [Daldinia childiae]
MAPQKPRCNFKECRSAAQRIVGDCGFCDGHFCAKHRLLEDHKCSGLEDVSMSPTPSESSDSEDWATEWWLVGLAEYLVDSGLLEEECGGGSCPPSDSRVLTPNDKCSARKNRTSETRLSSSPSGRRSSGEYKDRSAPRSSRMTARRRRRSPPGVRPRARAPIFSSSNPRLSTTHDTR